MWIIGKFGFVAICEDREDEDMVIVRARRCEHLDGFAQYIPAQERGDYKPWFDKHADYQYRARLRRETAVKAMAKATRDVNYDTLKAQVLRDGNLSYYDTLLDVWEALTIGLDERPNWVYEHLHPTTVAEETA